MDWISFLNMDSHSYRIEIRGHSSLYYFFIFLIAAIWFWAIWLWPYYLPSAYKLSLAILLLLTLVLEIRRKVNTPAVLTLSQSGRIIRHTEDPQGGWLQPNSKVYPGFFYLCYLPDVAKSKQSWVIYVDQLNDVDRRRMSRVLRAMKPS